jgi:hypothetical protein
MELVQNSAWILTKNAVMGKAWDLLMQMQAAQQQLISEYAKRFPAEVIKVPPKISKGENYKGLPWLVLDCPRYFEKGHYFAIRTLFWWGKLFSTTLHLTGRYKAAYSPGILSAYPLWRQGNYYISTGANEWEHHFDEDNYVPVSSLDPAAFETALNNSSFLKLAKKLPVAGWDDAAEFVETTFMDMMGVLPA